MNVSVDTKRYMFCMKYVWFDYITVDVFTFGTRSASVFFPLAWIEFALWVRLFMYITNTTHWIHYLPIIKMPNKCKICPNFVMLFVCVISCCLRNKCLFCCYSPFVHLSHIFNIKFLILTFSILFLGNISFWISLYAYAASIYI